MDQIELSQEEFQQLVKRAGMIGDKKLEIQIMEREAAYKIVEIVSAHGGDTSIAWGWKGNTLFKVKEQEKNG